MPQRAIGNDVFALVFGHPPGKHRRSEPGSELIKIHKPKQRLRDEKVVSQRWNRAPQRLRAENIVSQRGAEISRIRQVEYL